MKELRDYSGEFRPDLKLEDFSKETLVKAWGTTAKLYILLGGIWNSLVKEKFSEQTALEAEKEIWRQTTAKDIPWISNVFNIHGDDIATVFKHIQISPLIGVIYPTQFKMEARNHGIFTIPRCISLEYLERTNRDAMIELVCGPNGIDHWGFQEIARYYNPDIKVSPLKLPPRKSKDDIACQWEFKLEGQFHRI